MVACAERFDTDGAVNCAGIGHASKDGGRSHLDALIRVLISDRDRPVIDDRAGDGCVACGRLRVPVEDNADIAACDVGARSVDDVATAGRAGAADICKGDVDAGCARAGDGA